MFKGFLFLAKLSLPGNRKKAMFLSSALIVVLMYRLRSRDVFSRLPRRPSG